MLSNSRPNAETRYGRDNEKIDEGENGERDARELIQALRVSIAAMQGVAPCRAPYSNARGSTALYPSASRRAAAAPAAARRFARTRRRKNYEMLRITSQILPKPRALRVEWADNTSGFEGVRFPHDSLRCAAHSTTVPAVPVSALARRLVAPAIHPRRVARAGGALSCNGSAWSRSRQPIDGTITSLTGSASCRFSCRPPTRERRPRCCRRALRWTSRASPICPRWFGVAPLRAGNYSEALITLD